MRKTIHPLAMIGIMGTLVWGLFFGMQLFRAFGSNPDIYWTPRKLALPFEDTRNRFEILVGRNARLDDLLSQGMLMVEGSAGPVAVKPQDVSVRMNNWHEVKASILTHALWSGMVFSACLALLATGVFHTLANRSKEGQ